MGVEEEVHSPKYCASPLELVIHSRSQTKEEVAPKSILGIVRQDTQMDIVASTKMITTKITSMATKL